MDIQLENVVEIVLASLEISDSISCGEETFGGGKWVEFKISPNFSQSMMLEGFGGGRYGKRCGLNLVKWMSDQKRVQLGNSLFGN